jgi:hypothetical protein
LQLQKGLLLVHRVAHLQRRIKLAGQEQVALDLPPPDLGQQETQISPPHSNVLRD